MTDLPTALRRGLVGFGDAGRAWVDELPERIARLRRRWRLDLGPPFEPGGVTSWVAPAGPDAVLKIVVPHREAVQEPAGLRAWGGNGAVRLLDADPDDHALLLEWCRPGTALREAGRPDDEVLDVGADIAVRLWRPVSEGDPHEHLVDVMAEWADRVEERAARLRRPSRRDPWARAPSCCASCRTPPSERSSSTATCTPPTTSPPSGSRGSPSIPSSCGATPASTCRPWSSRPWSS